MFGNVNVTENRYAIRAQMTNVDGTRFDFTIQPGHAAIDGGGIIRFFSVEFDDGYTGNYKLLPKNSRAEQIANWIVDFLTGYGLGRLGANVMKGTKQVEHIGRYVAFSGLGGGLMKSFTHHVIPEHLGYFNVATDKLIFPNGVLRAPSGSY